MGIPYLYGAWLRSKSYRSVLKGYIPNVVSSCSIDANALVYMALQVVLGVEEFENKKRQEFVLHIPNEQIEHEVLLTTMAIIQSVVSTVNPTHHLIIAFDGPAPMTKVQQQKERRYKTAILRDKPPRFDTNCVTPGTKFMRFLDIMIREALPSWYEEYKIGRIIYSSHMVPGEGEHKIMDHYRSGLMDKDGVHVIYGMDADLIMLALVSPLKHIIIARDSIEVSVRNSTGEIVRSKNTKRNANSNIYVHELREAIRNEMGRPSAITDFSVIVSMVGNDFLPHIEATRSISNAIDSMIVVYKQLRQPLTDDNGIIFANLTNFLVAVSGIENGLINEFFTTMRGKSRMLEAAKKSDGTIDFPTFRNAWYSNEFNDSIDPRQVVDMSYQYIMGMVWTLQYYTKGQDSVTWVWYYPYHHAPTIYDMAHLMTQLQGNVFKVDSIPGESRFNAAQQLLAVIPRLSLDILPDMLVPFYAYDSPLAGIMPDSFPIETDGDWQEWQSRPIIPKVDYNMIINLLKDVHMEGWDHEEEIQVSRMKEDVDFMIQQRYREDKVEYDRANRLRWLKKRQAQQDKEDREVAKVAGSVGQSCKVKKPKKKKKSAWGSSPLIS